MPITTYNNYREPNYLKVKMKNYFDTIIVGAGPAGLAAATVLSKNGQKVAIFEKNKIIGPKVCAGGLTMRDFEIGVDRKIIEYKFNEMTLSTPLNRSFIRANYPYVATTTREELGQVLLRKAELNGVSIFVSKEIVNINKNSIQTIDEEYGFRNLIGADGSASMVRKHLGLKSKKVLVAFHYKVPTHYNKMELIFDAKLFGSGYAWIFPHKDFSSIGACVDPRFGLDAAKIQKNFAKWAQKRSIKLDSKDYQAWLINYDYQGYQFNNIFLAGDAAGFASGMTGEGISFALITGREIAKKILDPSYKTPEIDEVLLTKARQEKVLAKLQKNLFQTQLIYTFGGLLFKTHLFDRKLIKLFGG